MTSTQATPRAHLRPPGNRGLILRVVAVGIVFAFVLVGITTLTRGPAFVDRLTVVNPTRMPVEVSVAAPGSDDRLDIGAVAPRSRATFEDVVDMGDDWEMQLVANGRAEVRTTVSRAELIDGSWTFTVSEGLQSELTSRGGIPGLRD
ncbi:MAG: hypothetical protein ACXW1M_08245 [Acidimicrobiia bacterium]